MHVITNYVTCLSIYVVYGLRVWNKDLLLLYATSVMIIVRWHLACTRAACTSHNRLRCHLADYVGKVDMPGCQFPSDITFLNVNARRYVGKVVPEQIYVGSLFRNTNVNTALEWWSRRQVTHLPLSGIFHFSWHRHQIEGTDGFTAALPRRDKRTVQMKTRLEDGLDRRENEGRVIQRQW